MDKRVFKFDGEKMDVSWDGRLCIQTGELLGHRVAEVRKKLHG